MELFEYEFIRKAFLVGILLSIALPCIGHIIVLKRMSMIGDALSHTSLTGVAFGLMIGFDPVIGSIIACIIGALSIEFVSKYISKYKENAVTIIMSLAIGLAGLFSGFVKNGVSFTSFLFGSIVAISDNELILVSILVLIVLIVMRWLYYQLFYIVLDEKSAGMAGIKVNRINFLFTIITAIAIALASRTIGVLIVSSLLVIPILCAMEIAKSYKQTLIFGIMFSIHFVIIGLYASYYLNLRPGGTIALLATLTYIILLVFKRLTLSKSL